MAERMGLSKSYVHQLEVSKRTPSDSVETLVRMLEDQLAAGIIVPGETSASVNQDEARLRGAEKQEFRQIPVIGWAHAGDAASYEEIPQDWQDRVPTECRDPKAFAVRLEGDSMAPRFWEGDVLILQPSETAYSGCFVVAKFDNDGVVFRRIEMSGPRISLVPLNERYDITQHAPEEFSWIYPVWGRWTQIWKHR